MSARSPLNVKVRSFYANGVLFYTGTSNRFSLLQFFEYSLDPGIPFVLNENTSLDITIVNAPAYFNQVGGTTICTYNPQTINSGQIIKLNFSYVVYSPLLPGQTIRDVQTRLNAKANLKIVVQ